MAVKNPFISEEDIKSLTAAKKLPTTMLEPQYHEAFEQFKQNPEKNGGEMLRVLNPLIKKIAGKYGNGDPYLNAQGKLLAYEALKTYDPGKSSIATHLGLNLQRLTRLKRNETNIMAVPERVMMHHQALQSAEEEFLDEYGREPSTIELADKMGVSVKHIQKIRNSSKYTTSGSLEVTDEDGNTSTLQAAVDADIPKEYLDDFVMSALRDDPVGMLVYEYDNGLNGRKPISAGELAKKAKLPLSGVSAKRKQINQIANRFRNTIY